VQTEEGVKGFSSPPNPLSYLREGEKMPIIFGIAPSPFWRGVGPKDSYGGVRSFEFCNKQGDWV